MSIDGPPPVNLYGQPFVEPPQPENDAAGWQRLDPRMLAVLPAREVIRFLPALLVIFFAGSASGGSGWQFLGILVPVALGVYRYYTTSYRIGDARVELRSGAINRRATTVQLDRVRTVDLSAELLQRLFGLVTLKIGTATGGGDGDRLDLDGLPAERGARLRDQLLGRVAATDLGEADDAPDAVEAPAPEVEITRFRGRWLRYAPLTSLGLAIAGGLFGLAAQFGQMADVGDRLADSEASAVSVPGPVLIGGIVVVVATMIVVFAVAGYAVTNWAFRLTRRDDSFVVRRGLFTTREITLDADRVAGASLIEGLGVRAAGGARLQAIVTGLDATESGSAVLVPPAPAHESTHAAGRVLGDDTPATTELVDHGPAAARRRRVRALVPASLLVGAVVIAVALSDLSWWWLLIATPLLPAAAALAADRVRSLGHTLGDGILTSRSGSVVRQRDMLHVEHVIGWNLRATWFQRRQGLVTLVGTTAGGSQRITVLDVPEDLAVAVADRATPGLVDQFASAAAD